MFVYCLVNKFLILVKSCLYYILYNRYFFFYIILELRVEYNFKTFVN